MVNDLPAGLLSQPLPPGLHVEQHEPDENDRTGLTRYMIVHTASGARLTGPAGDRCAVHLDQAAAIVAAAGIDWTPTDPVTGTRARCIQLYDQLRTGLGICFDAWTALPVICAGDKPDAATETEVAA